MNDLGGALRELAGTAAAPGVADPVELWKHGRARVRRRRATAVLVAAVIAVVGYAAIVRPQPTVVMPAGEVHAPAIPKNIYSPTRFLAGVSDEGPPGQLAVIAQKSGDEDHAGPWFGVSATTGEYRYLDLPHEAGDSEMALSADGRRIAYWVTGPTRRSSFGKGDGLNAGGPLPERPLTGVAVYDTRTGEVVEHQVLTDFGVEAADGPQGGLAWLADDTLVFTYAVRMGSNSSHFAKSYRWSPVGSTPVTLPNASTSDTFYAPVLPGDGWITFVDGLNDVESLALVDAQGRPTGRTFTIDAMGSNGDGRLTVNSGRVVGVGVSLIDQTLSGDGSTTSLGVPRLSVGVLPTEGGKLTLRGVGTVVDTQFIGWLSTTRVLVTGQPGEKPHPDYYDPGDVPGEGALYPKEGADGQYIQGTWLYDVDVVTGKTRRVGVVDSDLNSVVAATDLLGKPMRHGDMPPSLVSALRVPIGVGALVLVGAAALWYRRRRPWRRYLARERERHA